jgi:hypothetical protein
MMDIKAQQQIGLGAEWDWGRQDQQRINKAADGLWRRAADGRRGEASW